MFLTYSYDLKLRASQRVRLEAILEDERLLYNAALQERRSYWDFAKRTGAKKKSISYADQSRSLTEIRRDDPVGFGGKPTNLHRWTIRQAHLAYAAYFDRLREYKNDLNRARGKPSKRPGLPRFKGKGRFRSFGFREMKGVSVVVNRLEFMGLSLRMHVHRPLPDGAVVNSLVVTRDIERWSVSLQVEMPAAQTPHPHALDAIGVDVGIQKVMALSNSETIDNPRLGRQSASRLRRAHRKLSRARHGSKRRKKTKIELQRAYRKLKNRRRSYLHRETAALARRYGLIACEDLDVKRMTASAAGSAEAPGKNVKAKSGLNREFRDVAPSILISMLTYKAGRAGGRVDLVDPRGTSIECSSCGEKVPKGLSQRMHCCPRCNLRIDRDVNAARNILRRAVAGPWSDIEGINVAIRPRRSGNIGLAA